VHTALSAHRVSPPQRRFAAVGLALSGVFAWAAAWQTLHPWQVVFHADFYGHAPSSLVAALDAAAAASLGAASHALLRAAAPTPPPDAQRAAARELTGAAALALATSVVWGVAWLRRAAARIS
jgi:hypothetical protein